MVTTSIRNTTVALGAGVNTLISEEVTTSRRIVLEICNLNAAGGDDVFVSVNEEAKANTGRRVQPGQTVTWSKDAGYTPPRFRINGYAAGATNVAIYEEFEAI